MEYCGGDQAFYKQLVENYLEEESEKREKLTTFCQKQDMKNYRDIRSWIKECFTNDWSR